MISVRVCTILQLVRVLGEREVAILVPEGSTVADLLEVVAARSNPPATQLLFADPSGTPHPSVRVLVNGRQLSFLQGWQTVLAEEDEVLILPVVGGG